MSVTSFLTIHMWKLPASHGSGAQHVLPTVQAFLESVALVLSHSILDWGLDPKGFLSCVSTALDR